MYVNSEMLVICSVWMCMCGVSIISTPWAVAQAGLAQAIVLMIFFAVIFLYSTTVIIDAALSLRGKCAKVDSATALPEYPIIIGHFLGKTGEIVAVLFNFLGIGLGINIVSYILIVKYLFGFGVSIFSLVIDAQNVTEGAGWEMSFLTQLNRKSH